MSTEEAVNESKTRHITVVIPEDSTAEEGDILEFNVDGFELSIPVPAGAKPGDAFDIMLSEDDFVGGDNVEYDDDDDDDEYETVTIDLFSDQPQETIPLLLDTSPIIIEENEGDDQGDGTYSLAWPSGVTLAKLLTLPSFSSSLIPNKTILEVGSGLGVVGLAAAVAGAKKVVLTDIPFALPVLSRSVKDTREGILQNLNPNVDLSVQSLVWGEDGVGLKADQFDIVVGSDLLYDSSNVEGYKALAKTLAGAPMIIMAVRWRKPDLERKFFEIMEESYGYTFELMSTPKLENQEDDLFLPCNLSWKEYGDPESEASKSYFQSMMVNVGEKETVSLSQLTEEQMEQLSDKEYAIFEAMQTQIYKGVPK